VVLPCVVFILGGAGLESVVQDADEPVRELPKGGEETDAAAAKSDVLSLRVRGCTYSGEGFQV